MVDEIPSDHPRAASLNIRHKIIDGMHKNIVAEAGLIAHGRGEAFDYLIGETTNDFALKAIKASAAALFLAEHPVISVNGNVAALCPEELVEFSNNTGIPIEINLFYRKPERIEAIKNHLIQFHPTQLFGTEEDYFGKISEISSQRRIVDKRGILIADWVFVPLEDGDRTEGLKAEGKNVITVDLNPLSRTSTKADITIVDNIIRVFPRLLEEYLNFKDSREAQKILENYDNEEIRKRALEVISSDWRNKFS